MRRQQIEGVQSTKRNPANVIEYLLTATSNALVICLFGMQSWEIGFVAVATRALIWYVALASFVIVALSD